MEREEITQKLEIIRDNSRLNDYEKCIVNAAIVELKRTAQEVSVQEQLVSKHDNTVLKIKSNGIFTTVHHKNH